MEPIVRIVQRAYRFALAPTPEQARVFASHAGGARYAYNWGLDEIYKAIKAQKSGDQSVKVPDHFTLCKMWTQFKDSADGPAWVGENSVGTYQAALRDAATARVNWLKSLKGQRAGRKMGRPKFKSKHRSAPAFQMHGPVVGLTQSAQIKSQVGWKWTTPARGAKPLRKKSKPLHHASVRGCGRGTPDAVKQPVVLDRTKFSLVLPKLRSEVAVPLQVWLPGYTDRNRRAARSLNRALRKPPVPCPPCKGTGQIVTPEHVLKSGVLRPEVIKPCTTCKGEKVAPYARIVRATISRGASGTWWASVTAEVVMSLPAIDCAACDSTGKIVNDKKHLADCKECGGRTYLPAPSKRQRDNGILGLDLGSRYLAVDSDGTIYPNPQHLGQSLAELKAAQRAFARCQPESKRREKARRRVGTIHERVGLQRRDSINQLATKLVRNFAMVAAEGWNVQRVAEKGSLDLPKHLRKQRNRRLADAAPGMLRTRLSLKAPWVGSTYFAAPKLQETARTCPRCGTVRAKPVPLHQDEFHCDNAHCGIKMDRRVASARVVKQIAAGGRSKLGIGGSGAAAASWRGRKT